MTGFVQDQPAPVDGYLPQLTGLKLIGSYAAVPTELPSEKNNRELNLYGLILTRAANAH